MGLVMQDLGKRIIQARERRGWSQRDLVRRSGVGQNNLSALEQGKKPSVRADTVVRLAEALRVSTDYLLIGKAAPRSRKTQPVG